MKFASTINLTIITMMIIIYLNEMRNISMFIFNFTYIKDLARIIMDEKCNNVYCEAETDRYQIAKNSYRLLMPNDVFNSKTYIIFTFIISIMIFIYYYRMLDLSNYEGTWLKNTAYVLIHASLLMILLRIIIYRYVPNDEAGYKNYFKNYVSIFDNQDVKENYGFFLSIIGAYVMIFICVFFIKYYKLWNDGSLTERIIEGINIFLVLLCFTASIILVINLMNIVMSFRTNTTPILKTKCLGRDVLQKSFLGHTEYKITDTNKSYFTIATEYDNIKKLTTIVNNESADPPKNLLNNCGVNISSALDVLIAFEELINVVINGHHTETGTQYFEKLKKIVNSNYAIIYGKKEMTDKENTSEFALIFDKKVSIPHDNVNNNYNIYNNNTDYVYTADISYDNANVFYEKYWDMKDTDGEFLWNYELLWNYDYFVPTYLFGGQRPNLLKILKYVAIFTFSILFIYFLIYFILYIKGDSKDIINILVKTLYDLTIPFIALVVFLTFIIVFIRFNTNFNKNVVYKCLDCSYKRALNKLNTVVSPYIRMYDNKITTGNKNYLHHYIITNVFYSILSGNINLVDNTKTRAYDDKYYYGTDGIKSNRLKFTGMNNSILSNDNQFREYYKSRYSDLYKGKNNTEITNDEIIKIYAVFSNIFVTYPTVPTTEAQIETYFQNYILKKDIILKIYSIIKKCFDLFKEETFNNNLVYYNNRDPNRDTATQITIDSYKHFAFYKNGDKLIPHQFILKLTKSEYEAFVGAAVAEVVAVPAAPSIPAVDAVTAVPITLYHTNTTKDFENTLGTLGIASPSTAAPDMTPILTNISDEDSINQTPEIRDKNLIKIIAKYLLILGHINYNGIEYNRGDTNTANKKKIFELRTYKLYQLISNVSYNDTYDGINDTFIKISDIASGVTTVTITDTKYKTLTYMYNYLETKYVSLSSNNNKNYLLNVVTSINNALNNDGKIITPTTGSKDSKYLFAKRIEEMNTPPEYEVEDEIYTKAYLISTTSFEYTYYMNLLILIFFIIGTIYANIKKSV